MKFTPIIIAIASIAAVANAVPVGLEKRRFGQEHTNAAESTYRAMRAAAAGTDFSGLVGDLSGLAVDNLLANAPVCGQQDVADKLIDVSKKFKNKDSKKKEQLIQAAIAYRKLERNTPGKGQPSALCNKQPRNKELKGITQAQDPTGGKPAKKDNKKKQK